MKRVIAVGLCVGVLSGCATDGSMTKQDIGTGVGVIGGAVLGSFLGKGQGRIVGALAGAAIGGLIGNQIGAMLDEEDQKALQAQANQALLTQPDNSQVAWASQRSGATATVVPENTRVETREVKVVREVGVAPAGQLDLIGAKYVAKSTTPVRLSPSTDGEVASSLPTGAHIWAVGKVSGQPWIMVAKNGKSVGYVSAAAVQPAPKTQAVAAKPKATGTSTAQAQATQQSAAAFDLDSAAPVRTPADLDSLGGQTDTVVASVTCRDIKTTATAKGETQTATQTACKSPDGAWQLN